MKYEEVRGRRLQIRLSEHSFLSVEMLLLHGSRHFDPRSGVKVFVTDMVQGARRVALENGPILSKLSTWTEGDL